MDEKQKQVLAALQALCAKREYCSSEMRRKALQRMEGDEDAADAIVTSLLEDRFVDDARYAAAFAREKSSLTGWGPHKISFALRAKGVDREAIRNALEEVDTERADGRLRKLLESKARSLTGDEQIRFKLIKYALGRGYDYSDGLRATVDEILSGQDVSSGT